MGFHSLTSREASTVAVESLFSPLIVTKKPVTGDRLTGSWVTVSTGSALINCTDGSVSLSTPILVPVYN